MVAMGAKVTAAALLLLSGLGADGLVLRSAVGCGEFTRRSVCAPNRTVPGQRKALLHQHCTLAQCTGACETQAQNGCCEFDNFGGGACAWVPWGVETPGKPSHSAAVCSGGPPPPPPLPPPPPPPGPPTATTSCVGCWNKASGQCQINPMAGSCTFAQPSDCAAIPVRLRISASRIFLSSHTCVYTYCWEQPANGSNWVWTNTSMWSWSYGCMSRIRSEHCDMVAEFSCPDDGKNDGHGEYLPRKGAPGVTVPHHTATPEACIAEGEQASTAHPYMPGLGFFFPCVVRTTG